MSASQTELPATSTADAGSVRVVMLGDASHPQVRRWQAGMTARGWPTRLISLGGQSDSTAISYPRSGKAAYIRYWLRVRTEIERCNPAVVHVQSVSGYGLWSHAAGRRPRILSAWGSDIDRFGQSVIGRVVVQRALNRAAVVTATSAYLAKRTGQLLPRIAKHIQVVPFGVEPALSVDPMPPSPPLRVLALKGDREINGIDVLIRAAAQVVADGTEILITLTRAEPLAAAHRRLAQELGIGSRLTILPRQPHEQIPGLLASHHLLVMPSRLESFGVASLEAQAHGRPVIATDIGGLPETINADHTGLVVPADDSDALARVLRQLANDRRKLEQLGAAGPTWVADNYAWSTSLDQMVQIYEQVIANA